MADKSEDNFQSNTKQEMSGSNIERGTYMGGVGKKIKRSVLQDENNSPITSIRDISNAESDITYSAKIKHKTRRYEEDFLETCYVM